MSASIENLKERLAPLGALLDIEGQRRRAEQLREESRNPRLWDDPETARTVTTELAAADRLLTQWDELQEFLGLADDLSAEDIAQLEKQVRELELRALLSGSHDESGAIITIHAGTGGTDAQDFAAMLERMFLRYVEQGKTEGMEDRTLSVDRSDWKATILDENRGEEAGIKKAVIEVTGTMAYGLLKSEAGVHRLVRQSPFNAKGLRQTSFVLVEVVPEIDQRSAPAINEADLRIDIYRSGGHGGQGVNTTDSAVRITHIPSGIVVAIQNERSQHQNKATAMKILQSRLAYLQELKNAEERAILKGEFKEGSWGNQIRSYVIHPYQMVKDHRTDAETSQTQAVLDGDLKLFIESYLTRDTNQ